MDRNDSRSTHPTETAPDDSASPSNPLPPAESPPPGDPPPWEGDPPEEIGRPRHDAFTGARKQQYLKALAKVGCILDACRITGVSSKTVYNHQKSDPEFERYCELALEMASTPIELTAYERAVVGQEEPVIRGGKVVGTRIRRSDYMLRVLLQGSSPKKYGARPGFGRKRLAAFERKQIEREIRARIAEEERKAREGPDGLMEKLNQMSANIQARRLREDEQRRAQGWTELSCEVWVPPGWVWTGDGDPGEAVAELEKKLGAV
jgi:hypothetical protein